MIASAEKTKTVAPFFSPGQGSTELLTGEAVLSLLENTRFMNGWNHLYSTCARATVFQSPSFVATWYRIYKATYLPILIKTECAGKLTGLLTLAKDNHGLITGAGANQAEYQVWLTADENDDTFIRSALTEIHRVFPRNNILLKYIPAGFSLDFTKKDPVWNKRCFVKTHPQPVMIIDDAHLTSELKKKNRKEKINRLKRLGELKFERISDYKAFASIFDELAVQADFRKGAMYNKVAFKTDPLRKKFLLALFEQNNLHTTVLKLNNNIISCNVSVQGNNQLHLQGINSFAAAFARYSPGIIHFLMLGKLMAEEGVDVFDLTPGADAYKETLATDHSVAYTLSIGNNFHSFTNRLKAGLTDYLKKTAAVARVKPGTLKKWQRSFTLHKEKLVRVTKQGIKPLFAYFFNQLKGRSKTTTCWIVPTIFKTPAFGLLTIQKDNLNNLLDFDQRDIRYSQQEFLAGAMQRFEEGAHCYSWAEDGVLLGCAWITNMKTEWSIISMSGLYCHPKGRNQFYRFLKSVAAEVAIDTTHSRIYIITESDNYSAFEKAGFILVETTK